MQESVPQKESETNRQISERMEAIAALLESDSPIERTELASRIRFLQNVLLSSASLKDYDEKIVSGATPAVESSAPVADAEVGGEVEN